MRVWPKSHQGHWMVYGHSHQELPPQGLSFDIGVEGHNYAPWSLEEIESKMNKLTQHHVIAKDAVWDRSESHIHYATKEKPEKVGGSENETGTRQGGLVAEDTRVESGVLPECAGE